MPSKAVQVQLPTGDVIWARVPAEGAANVSSGVLHRLDIEDLRATVRGVSESLREALDDLAPSQVQIEFGLALAAKTGKITSLLAEVGATATIKIALTWQGEAPATMTIAPAAGGESPQPMP
jgi:hypothetical protein